MASLLWKGKLLIRLFLRLRNLCTDWFHWRCFLIRQNLLFISKASSDDLALLWQVTSVAPLKYLLKIIVCAIPWDLHTASKKHQMLEKYYFNCWGINNANTCRHVKFSTQVLSLIFNGSSHVCKIQCTNAGPCDWLWCWKAIPEHTQRALIGSLAPTHNAVRTIQTWHHFFSLTPRALARHTSPIFVFTGYLLIYFIQQLLRKQVVTRTLLC